ncbi:hypothetical protein EYC84_008009 [Monilinia fructicola]|uniref:Glutaminase n=1 Tax=Monilinia fructicola TaxID=38448 RepID=A0A5M9JGT4_MONFR|nr:hypothetical protein EYC84_008009 [Monilinia fructicola]
MRLTSYLEVAFAITATVTQASTLTPPVIPLIVRNPYLSAWLGHARENPWEHWPIFWTGQEIGFSVLASVPQSDRVTVYPLLGRPQDSLSKTGDSFNVSYPTFLGATFDASTTNLTYNIPSPYEFQDPLEVVLSFLSPITPTSTFRQAIPAAYLTVHVTGGFDLNVYLDINGFWHFSATSNRLLSNWNVAKYRGHQLRGIMDEEPVFAFAYSFKLNSTSNSSSAASGKTDASALFTIAHIQDPVIQFASARGLTAMRPLWASYYPHADALLDFHYHDFHKAFHLANNYSDQLAIDALQSGSEDYKDILALSARQVLGAASFSGTPDDPIIFFKEISSDGNMNTIDVIYPAFPFFLYTNPRWLAYMLEPLIEHMLSGQYPNDYAMHDLGSSFPNATGHPDGRDEYMPVEECGNMLIMGLALVNSLKYDTKPASIWSDQGAHKSAPLIESAFPLLIDAEGMDDTVGGPIEAKGEKQARKWVKKSYKLWKQWTGYLVRETLIPSNQLSTDDFAGWLSNQTNLALKGIIGIKAMSEIAEVVGETEDAVFYRNVSETYIKRWEEEFAISRDGTHAKLAYSCDKIYKLQSDWYHSVRQKYGLPLDSRHLYTKSDWEFFAVSVASKKVREEIVDSIALWVNETTTDKPLTDLYDTEGTGGFPGIEFKARPVVGGHFAFLALERACDGKAVAALDFLNEDEEQGMYEKGEEMLMHAEEL